MLCARLVHPAVKLFKLALKTLLQRVEIAGYIPSILIADLKIRHCGLFVDMRRAFQPLNHILSRIFAHAGDVSAKCDFIKRRADDCVRARNTWNCMATPAAILPNRTSAALWNS